MLLNYIKKILKNRIIKKRKFKYLKQGDLVWAKMPLKRKELKKIEKSHRIRPYLIVEKKRNYILCIEGTSNINNYNNELNSYILDKKKYDLSKSSMLYLNELYLIKYLNIGNKIITLDNCDCTKIFKRIYVINSFNRYKYKLKLEMQFNYEIGDVIQHDSNYLIYEKYKNELYTYKIKKKYANNKKYNFIINNKIWSIYFDETIKFVTNKKYKIANIFSKEDIEKIKKRKKDLKYQKKKQKV